MQINSILKKLFLLLFFFHSVNFSFSQLNQWTWIKGPNYTNSTGSGTTPDIPSTLNDPRGRRMAASWKDKNGNFWIFGGLFGDLPASSYLNDLWKYNQSTNEWVRIPTPAGPHPSGRFGSAYWRDKTDVGFLWLFGGFGFTNTGLAYLNDLWKFNPLTNQWTFVSGDISADHNGVYGDIELSSDANKPGGRFEPVSWIDVTGNLWMFGGVGYAASNPVQGGLNDLWKYNVTDNVWTWVKGDSIIDVPTVNGIQNVSSPSNKPGYRASSLRWVDAFNNLWLLGGSNFTNDLWKYNISLNEWVWVNGNPSGSSHAVYGVTGIPDPANKPGTILSAPTWTDTEGNLWLMGGSGYTDTQFGDLNGFWKYNITGNVWTFVGGDHATLTPGVYGTQGIPDAANKPGARQGACGWIDDIGNLWMFGGGGYLASGNPNTPFNHNDIWKYTLNIAVPVKLVSFTGQLKAENVLLKWVVENEINFSHYEIERSTNGIQFEKLTSVNSMNLKNYNAIDNVAEFENKIVYYRLKMIDRDGKFSYSNIIHFNVLAYAKFNLYPNPANTYTEIKFSKKFYGKADIEISDITSRIVTKNTYEADGSNITISTATLQAGTYTVTVLYSGERYSQNLVIIK